MATNLKPYGEYKETEYDWLGEVPEHWKRVTVRSITELSNERNGSRDDLELLSVYREYGVIKKSSRDDNHNVESQDLSNYKFVDKGYLVLNKMKMWQGSLGVSQFKGIVSPAYIVCKLVGEINFKYVHYLLRSPQFKTIYNRISYGVRVGQWDMRYDDFKNIKLYLPTLDEQDQIVKYLDSQLAKINKFINAKKKLISALKEKKKVLINEAVTKGLDSNVKMKPSGSDWLGDIPEHWEVLRLRFLCDIKTGDKDTINRDPNGQYPFYVRSPNVERISTYSYDGEAILTAGDGVGAGKVFHYANGKFDYHQRVYNLHNFNTIFPKYLYFYLKENFSKEIERGNAKSTVDSIRLPMLRNFPIAFGSEDEQIEIVNYITSISEVIDKSIVSTEKEISLITEYRVRLISDVVTGKVDVRNILVKEIIEDNIDVDEEEFIENDEVVDSEECEV